MVGDAGDDVVDGGAGNDILRGGDGDDWQLGGTGDDRLFGDAGNDMLEGGDGDDVIEGGEGCDTVAGGAGNDTVIGDADHARDDYDGGDGFDTLDYSKAAADTVFDLLQQGVIGLDIGTDTIAGFEAFVGGDGDDLFLVADEPVTLTGGAGDDIFDFSAATLPSYAQHVAHEITDFSVGDMVKMKDSKIYKEVVDIIEDKFEDIYGNDVDEDELPIRIRHEGSGNLRQTFIEADFDMDDIYEMSINIGNGNVHVVVDYA